MFPMLHGVLSQTGGVTYLLRDEFTTDAAAQLTSPRTCEPGPGTLTITDTGNKLSISSGVLNFSGTGAADPRLVSSQLTRQAGRVSKVVYRRSATHHLFGWNNNTPGTEAQSAYAFNLYASLYLRDGANNFDTGVTISNSTDYTLSAIMRGTGAFMAVSGGVFSTGKLMWVSVANTANLYPWLANANGTGACTWDSWKITDLPSPWATDYGIADVHATPGVSGTDYTGQANAIIDQAVTAPASLAGEAGYWFRKQDASNGYKAYFDSAGAFLVDRYVAGTPTNVVSVAGVITGSGTRTIRVIADGTALRFYTLSGTTWTARGTTITDTNFSSQTTITPTADASWTGGGGSIGQLDSWPRTLSGAALAALEAV